MTDYIQFLLAQTEEAGGAAPAQTETGAQEPGSTEEETVKTKPSGFLDGFGLPLILMLVVMYFLMFRGPKKKQKERQLMLDNMQKNDRVQTIGGILATVVDLRDDEVVIKIDETSNTKMRVTRGAISRIVTEDEAAK